MDRQVLVSNQNRECNSNVTNFKMVLDYNVQNKKFEKIVQNNWSLLKQDKVLGPVLPLQPQFIYKKSSIIA